MPEPQTGLIFPTIKANNADTILQDSPPHTKLFELGFQEVNSEKCCVGVHTAFVSKETGLCSMSTIRSLIAGFTPAPVNMLFITGCLRFGCWDGRVKIKLLGNGTGIKKSLEFEDSIKENKYLCPN
jgi:hypothetical protein